jgi:mycothiol synthase
VPRWQGLKIWLLAVGSALDLAAVAPDGSMAGFCIAWLDQASATAHIEPLGISPGLRRLGLGHAMVSAVLGRARDCGAQAVTVQTGAVHGPAVAFYQRAGFEAACRVLRKGHIERLDQLARHGV